ncbi:MAG: hypothetical protein AUG51_23655 [Acidobacteria bacterium 13_1_20CM_3_53_8]|jgi:hypothetical protein|nr:MAG: hypothetical protein AUG51_23655 [Acidobacteria bacterium 13_1_20CM_3_53_8]
MVKRIFGIALMPFVIACALGGAVIGNDFQRGIEMQGCCDTALGSTVRGDLLDEVLDSSNIIVSHFPKNQLLEENLPVTSLPQKELLEDQVALLDSSNFVGGLDLQDKLVL